MIKSIFESKYIKTTILITCIVIIMICFIGIRFGNEMISDEVVYGTVEWSKNGDYLLSNMLLIISLSPNLKAYYLVRFYCKIYLLSK